MSWARMRDGMNKTIQRALSDGVADYLSATGMQLASGVEVIIDMDVDRIDVVSGMIDRAVTITVRREQLQPIDRKGAFRLPAKTWHIDAIAADDGHMITFYVVP